MNSTRKRFLFIISSSLVLEVACSKSNDNKNRSESNLAPANGAQEATGQTNPPTPPTPPPTSSPKPVPSLSDALEAFEKRISAVNTDGLSSLRLSTNQLQDTMNGMRSIRSQNADRVSQIGRTRGLDMLDLLKNLKLVAEQQDGRRHTLFLKVRDLELQLYDALGSAATDLQINWSTKLVPPMEMARELSVKTDPTRGGILEARDAMKKETGTLFAVDKTRLNLVIDGYYAANLELLEVSAAANAYRALKRISELENEILLQAGTNAAARVDKLRIMIDGEKLLLKMPLDVFDPSIFPKIVETETALITADMTVKAIDEGLKQLQSLLDSHQNSLTEIEKVHSELGIEFQKLQNAVIAGGLSEPSLVPPVMGGASALAQLSVQFVTATSEYRNLINVLAKNAPVTTQPQAIGTALGTIGGVLAVVKESTVGLNAIIKSKGTCSIGIAGAYAGVQKRKVTCPGVKDPYYILAEQ